MSTPAREVAAEDPREAALGALAEGRLDAEVDPQSLFEVRLDDEAALQVEATRVRALLDAVEQASQPPPPTPPRKGSRVTLDAGVDASALRAKLAAVDPARLERRLALDRARLAFLELPFERRAELLRAHGERVAALRARESEEARLAREAQAERARALELARQARSESERLVGEELARLIALEDEVRGARRAFDAVREQVLARRETVLGWQRRARDAAATRSGTDETYDALRRALRLSRDELSTALEVLGEDRSALPTLGADPLADLPADIPLEAVRERRAAVQRAIAEARRDERALQESLASALLDEINALNRERLGLLGSLSPEKRGAITGFTSTGWDQARSEIRHLSLTLRYHAHVARGWLEALRGQGETTFSVWEAGAVLVPLLLAIIAFVFARRRTRPLLVLLEGRLAASDRAERRTEPSRGRRAVRALLRMHRSLEWTLFFLVTLWLLPDGATELLEVQLVSSVVGWSLVGAVVVNLINAVAASNARVLVPLDEDELGRLRLRSLRLVGRTVVGFALLLMLSARLVGEGTIFKWVLVACWFAALPVFLLLVRWWRTQVFERLDRARKKTPLQAWLLANRSGWKSVFAAMIGALQLFGLGAYKVVRGWLSGFDLARRIHAYLFKREIERIEEAQADEALRPLPAEALEALHPERHAAQWLSCPADELLDGLLGRIAAGRGGLVAIVGPRGMGKSTLLRALDERTGDDSVLVGCSAEGSLAELCTAARFPTTGAAPGSTPRLVLLDDVQALVAPRIGGLARFDELVAFARRHGEQVTWVFAVDASLWPLLKRARDARPMFDETHVLEPWDERQIGALLAQRCGLASITPTYEDLLEPLPAGADEVDRQDALHAKRVGYQRMLWDHVGGNPALALEVWRTSLAKDEAGAVRVRALKVADVAKLEALSDSSLFVLRAVLQLAPASAAAVAEATRLRRDEVLQDFRFGRSQGFLEEHDGRVRVAWPWVRAVTRLLERRHLLVMP